MAGRRDDVTAIPPLPLAALFTAVISRFISPAGRQSTISRHAHSPHLCRAAFPTLFTQRMIEMIYLLSVEAADDLLLRV